ncbi:MAG: acyltransferase family protein [Eubacteriales bacterium]|nr:acyltransferase family protein [Eubacteriales bacterium]
MMEQTKKRIEYLDIAKAIAIFLVVVGHVAQAYDAPYWRVAIYSFHMPLFFIVSGITTSRHIKVEKYYSGKAWWTFIKKNIFALLIPYLIWALIFMPFDFAKLPGIFYGSWDMLNTIGTNVALWYLPALFLARLEMNGILAVSARLKLPRRIFALICAVLAFVIAFVIPYPKIGYPLGFAHSLIGLGFMLIGYACKDILDAVSKKAIWIQLIIMAAALALFFFGTTREDIQLVTMFSFQFGNKFWFFWNALSGTLAVFMLSSVLSSVRRQVGEGKIYRFIVWLGQNTIGIYLLHLPFARNFIAPLLDSVGIPRLSFWGALVDGVIVMAICCVLVKFIEKYIPQLFGRNISF